MIQIDPRPLQPFTHLELIARQVVEGFITGLHKSPFHGFSVEFAEHRIYNKGESTKHIDWKLFGKTDKLFIKRYEEETNLRCQIIIDDSSSMYFPIDSKPLSSGAEKGGVNKITFSAYCAAALIELLKRQRDAVGLSIFSDDVDVHTPAKSSSLHHKMLYHELEKRIQLPDLNRKKKTSAIKALHEISEAIHKRSLVMIFSDMMDSKAGSDELFSALQHLKHNKHEVVLFHVTDKKKELDFEFENRPYKFVDLETGEEIKLHPNEIRETYLSQMSAYKQDLMLKCGQFKIDFVEADINEGFDQVLMPYLVKRTKMM
ncbi:MAG: DUF58 domain-containing protein [Bacteroidota bacterium]|nr:DUF58 domain-containing protein [Bacteroidota bacterium]